jgi:hypothetical protein
MSDRARDATSCVCRLAACCDSKGNVERHGVGD